MAAKKSKCPIGNTERTLLLHDDICHGKTLKIEVVKAHVMRYPLSEMLFPQYDYKWKNLAKSYRKGYGKKLISNLKRKNKAWLQEYAKSVLQRGADPYVAKRLRAVVDGSFFKS